uniref:Uncharacterized protein n=1 Tax=Ciona intestinalis TaxID=7719 RepID=H2Y2M5_CIOIN
MHQSESKHVASKGNCRFLVFSIKELGKQLPRQERLRKIANQVMWMLFDTLTIKYNASVEKYIGAY